MRPIALAALLALSACNGRLAAFETAKLEDQRAAYQVAVATHDGPMIDCTAAGVAIAQTPCTDAAGLPLRACVLAKLTEVEVAAEGPCKPVLDRERSWLVQLVTALGG